MAPGCFKALWCTRQPPSPSDDAVVPQVPAPVRAAQPPASVYIRVLAPTEVPVEASDSPSANAGGLRAENTRPRSPSPSSSSGDTGIPIHASIQASPLNNTGALAPALIKAQPTGPPSEESVDTPAPAHTEEVPMDPAKARTHIDRIKRFRILVIGRANAGKITILQRVCDTTNQPEIFHGKGEKVDATVVQGSLVRGYHNIEDELVFKSTPCFVFHASRGFEAGSEEEIDMVKEFVMDRAKRIKLEERIHIIWFCIPLNESHRMVTHAEKIFFEECDTGHVPVIVLLTKADTLDLDAFLELIDDGLNEDDAVERAAEVGRRKVNECLVKIKGWLDKSRFPPHDYLSLAGMQEEGADCTTLLTCTANVLREQGLHI
ncbi:hypothetical protein BKA82DRAFT_1000496 [Pisolithus tinctorius]|uniref:G domain-containing protein n=1 Tax=Pisolithus tinctorius Marx 270 TaxID=870435 RepID=A0A0C3PAQ9_PISTI|nr:hypothetical protein BKA82DRAFT_1000496 [Pisolithus tinctorius]KIO04699.1 hypothetical protein M404DRAFT_1000496 [Pisolithus tinctorius Marx 270]